MINFSALKFMLAKHLAETKGCLDTDAEYERIEKFSKRKINKLIEEHREAIFSGDIDHEQFIKKFQDESGY